MPDAQTAQLGRRIGRLALLIVIIATMVQGGLRLRLWAYAASGEFRFRGDITNAWQQGLFVLEGAQAIQNDSEPVRLGSFIKSYLGRYDQAMSESQRGTYRLDYPPARLLIMSAWAWRMEQFARNNDLAPYDYRIVWPLLCLNALFELAGSAAAFLLVRSVLQRQGVRNAEFIALIPAALIWFNLAMIIDAHVWPQWDTWLIPFYLLAAYAAVERKWVLAGMALGFGAMFKGQMLLTMAVFILWPLFQMRWRAVLEVAAGILLGAMIYAAPWMVHSMGVGVCVLLFFVLLGAGFRWINPTWRPLYVASGIGVTLLIAGLFWGGSFGWWWVGFEYGSHHYMNMTMGPTPNLAAILSDGFSFGLRQELFSITPDIVVTTRSLMITIYIAALVLC
ncbi:MAG TPA: glycosyltransferase family 87 protein, partial [Tepidisphaeraceae bacterium]